MSLLAVRIGFPAPPCICAARFESIRVMIHVNSRFRNPLRRFDRAPFRCTASIPRPTVSIQLVQPAISRTKQGPASSSGSTISTMSM
ncbi:hypothetical protein BDZ89DRAFT_1059240 [Hymenopellis radicata]|nr:hypothetical protein BDZ89DRAFT_1059240 [Hymenopellis radicata]